MVMNGSVFLSYFWTSRKLICSIMWSIHGLFLPGINSMRAILYEDEDSIKEYLTYWCVLSVLSFLEYFLDILDVFKNYPPELKVLFSLWLTLPRFQGAYRLYTFILKPYFERYEEDIDKHITIVTGKVKETAFKNFKHVLYQVFLGSNDGLVNIAMSSVLNDNNSYNAISSLIPLSDKMFNGISSLNKDTQPSETNKDLSSVELGRLLLNQFRTILLEGISLDCGLDLNNDFVSSSLTLANHDNNLVIESVSNENSFNLDIPIISIISVETCDTQNLDFDEDKEENPVQILLLSYFQFIKDCVADNISISYNRYYLKVSTNEESDTLLAGLKSLARSKARDVPSTIKKYVTQIRQHVNSENSNLYSQEELLGIYEEWNEYLLSSSRIDDQEM
eukprot:gene12851-17225_t